MRLIFVLLGLALGLAAPLPAAAATPLGLWQQLDDKTGTVRSNIEIYEEDGKLFGKIVKLLDPNAPPNAVCDQCKKDDPRHMQPIEGLIIITDMVQKGDRWEGGKILDPENGNSYGCRIWLEGTDTLKVRGYLGVFYRTQTWSRGAAQ